MGLPFSNPTESKVNKFFGERAPLVSPAARSVDEKPWYLQYEYDASELLFNMEVQVKGGTLRALVERLTIHDVVDTNFHTNFLLTYRSFTTTSEFLSLLIRRYHIQPPPGLKPEELKIWNERKLKMVRVRVYNIIKTWLEIHYVEDSDMDGLRTLRDFACTSMVESNPAAAEQVVKLIDKRRQSSDGAFKKLVRNLPKQAPPPILPRNFRKLKVFDIDALELARQFTILDSKMYNKIKPTECLSKAWMGQDPTRAVNIKAMVQLSTKVSLFVGGTILSEPELRKRGNIIKYFITVAEKCRSLNNFNALMSFLGGIELASVQRLKRTWDTLGGRTMTTYESLKVLMGTNRNSVEYREELHSCNPPCIPFLGTHLKDLVFVEDGNSDFLPNHPHLINFDKRTKVASVIRDLQSYQSTPYALTVVPEIQEFMEKSLEEVIDSPGLYDISLTLEPREREDEKIARLLRESGFL
ncbi:ras guanine nucleotide exchange factor domain-containing protein [Dimargaris cristalligena]|uniref:Ras guanine nucleotide exchange factor domain-containing protein n=1 Tax=Dimargaris cristalligena TaxID=215637 RepID=A0A4P9ZUR7_9FUNG|nr:ras guanine nucleotide exchange factor domain-containing protein [Dimargaris cristalligena]|eukprot:RKP37346.1 ras guanine nucleotide exchange factor domain-containing protein [Dimargaris cristalligena]